MEGAKGVRPRIVGPKESLVVNRRVAICSQTPIYMHTSSLILWAESEPTTGAILTCVGEAILILAGLSSVSGRCIMQLLESGLELSGERLGPYRSYLLPNQPNLSGRRKSQQTKSSFTA